MTAKSKTLVPLRVFGSRLYRTEYKLDQTKRHLFWAKDRMEARWVAHMLGMAEPTEKSTVTLQELAWDVPNAPRSIRKYLRGLRSLFLFSRACHAATYLCFLALRSGVATVEETLGDYGLLHGLVHMGQFHPYRAVPGWVIESATTSLLRSVDTISGRVPGYSPRGNVVVPLAEIEQTA